MYFSDVDYMRLVADSRKQKCSVEELLIRGCLDALKEARQRQSQMTSSDFNNIRAQAIQDTIEDDPSLLLGEVTQYYSFHHEMINESLMYQDSIATPTPSLSSKTKLRNLKRPLSILARRL